MMRRLATRLCCLLAPVALTGIAWAAESVPGPVPQELIESAATRMLQALDADREAARKDPKRVQKMVDEILLPNFDTDYSARLVLGKHWRDASPELRKQFIDAFYQSLLRNYGSALAEFTADRMVVLPFRGDLSSGQAIVRTEVKRSDGTRVPVNYTLRATPAGWKAWDVTIEGISSVIERLKTESRGDAPKRAR
jgi:phospholipid transport system substrate-binding protein